MRVGVWSVRNGHSVAVVVSPRLGDTTAAGREIANLIKQSDLAGTTWAQPVWETNSWATFTITRPMIVAVEQSSGNKIAAK